VYAAVDKLIRDDGDGDNDAEWRAELIKRYGTVTGFLDCSRASSSARSERARRFWL
jgi:hypothetical protein